MVKKVKILPFVCIVAVFGIGYFTNSIITKKEMENCLMTSPEMDNQRACINTVLGIKQ